MTRSRGFVNHGGHHELGILSSISITYISTAGFRCLFLSNHSPSQPFHSFVLVRIPSHYCTGATCPARWTVQVSPVETGILFSTGWRQGYGRDVRERASSTGDAPDDCRRRRSNRFPPHRLEPDGSSTEGWIPPFFRALPPRRGRDRRGGPVPHPTTPGWTVFRVRILHPPTSLCGTTLVLRINRIGSRWLWIKTTIVFIKRT